MFNGHERFLVVILTVLVIRITVRHGNADTVERAMNDFNGTYGK